MAMDENPGSAETPAELRLMQARIAQLEADVSELRQMMSEKRVGNTWKSPVVPEMTAAVPLPPPPPAVAMSLEPQVSETAASAAYESVTPERPHQSLENRLGSQYFNRIAIVLLLTGTAYGMKLAVDRGFIGPAARVILGLLAGAGLVLWSERFRKQGFAAFSYSLKALGSSVLYLALWAAFRLYHLLPAWMALLLMLLVTAWNAYMAWAQNAQLLASYAVAGGFATPLLLSTGGNHEVFLFTYLLAIDVATTLLVRLRRWPRLLLAAFPATVLYFVGWYWEYYAAAEFGITCLFSALFAGVFAAVPLWPRMAEQQEGAPALPKRAGVLENVLLPLANAAFAALAFYAVLQDSQRHAWLPWLMIALAASYLVMMRLPQQRTTSAIHLSLAVVFLTIAIPLKASGHWITVSWLVEGVALTWVATRLIGDEVSAYAARTLRTLSAGALCLGFFSVAIHVLDTVGADSLPFFHRSLGTALTGIAAFCAVAWLSFRAAEKQQQDQPGAWWNGAQFATGLVPTTSALLCARELASWSSWPHPPFQTAAFLTALLALAVFAGVIAVAVRQMAAAPQHVFWMNLAALCTVAFNLIAVLTGVREVSALFAGAPGTLTTDAALQQSLAISGFLMLYGAALLGLGFLKRNGFLRWQALALLVFTICKAFLYDMRNLSQGYRVVSLLALGAVLMGVSFAYQKDWLNLKAGRPLSKEQEAP